MHIGVFNSSISTHLAQFTFFFLLTICELGCFRIETDVIHRILISFLYLKPLHEDFAFAFPRLFKHTRHGFDGCLNVMVPAVYMRMLLPTDANLIAFGFLRRKWWWLQGVFLGRLVTRTVQTLSKFGWACSSEGRSIMNSPYSSETPFASQCFFLLPPVLHVTATAASAKSHTQRFVKPWQLKHLVFLGVLGCRLRGH